MTDISEKHWVPLKYWWVSAILHGLLYQKTAFFIHLTMRTWNLTCALLLLASYLLYTGQWFLISRKFIWESKKDIYWWLEVVASLSFTLHSHCYKILVKICAIFCLWKALLSEFLQNADSCLSLLALTLMMETGLVSETLVFNLTRHS